MTCHASTQWPDSTGNRDNTTKKGHIAKTRVENSSQPFTPSKFADSLMESGVLIILFNPQHIMTVGLCKVHLIFAYFFFKINFTFDISGTKLDILKYIQIVRRFPQLSKLIYQSPNEIIYVCVCVCVSI